MPKIDCPYNNCDETGIDTRGAQSHFKAAHGATPAEAKQMLDLAKNDPLSGDGDDGGGWSPPSGQGGSFLGPATSSTPPDDPRLQELDRQIEETRRLAELERLRSFLESDEKDDNDVLEQIAKLKELGLLGDGDDDGRTDTTLRALAQQVSSLRQMVDNGGGQRPSPVPVDGDAPLVALALSSGVTDSDVIARLAETQPAVAQEKYRWKREELKWDRRDQLVRDLVDRLTAPEIANSLTSLALRAIGGGGGEGAADALAAVRDAGEDGREGHEAAAEAHGGLRAVETPARPQEPREPREPGMSPAKARALAAEDEDPFADEEPEPAPVDDEPGGGFRSPDG